MFIANGKYDFPQIKDGLSNTIAIAERPALFVKAPWVGRSTREQSARRPAPVFVSEIHPPESMPMARFYTRPINDPWSEPYDFFSPHPSVMNTLFADGSVRPLRFTTPAISLAPWPRSRVRKSSRFPSDSCRPASHGRRVPGFCYSRAGARSGPRRRPSPTTLSIKTTRSA